MNKQQDRSKRRYVLIVVLTAYWLAMFIGTHVPSPSIEPAFPNQDKVFHVLAYAGLAVLISGARASWGPVGWRWATVVLVILAVYGALDELTQNFVPGRLADALDWLADVAGGMLGITLFAVAAFVMDRRIAAHEE